MFPVTSQGHALVDVDFQIHLPALPLIVGTVLPVGHGVFLFLFRLGFHNRKAVLQTQLVRRFPKQFQGFLVAVVLLPGVAAYRVDDEVGVDVIPVCVGGNYNLKAGNLLRQLQSNLVRHLRGDRIIRAKGLHHVVVQSSLCTVVHTLGVHELLQRTLRHAVDAADQRSALIIHLGCLAAVVEDAIQTADSLGTLILHEVNDGHFHHRPFLRRSDSKELTEA